MQTPCTRMVCCARLREGHEVLVFPQIQALRRIMLPSVARTVGGNAKANTITRDQNADNAADRHHPSAQANLGYIYAHGEGVPQDFTEAAKWYRKSADQGVALAQQNLGFQYFNGLGVPQDFAESAKWYRLAAQQGDPVSM